MSQLTGNYTKDRLMQFYGAINQIEDLLTKAAGLFNTMPREVQNEIYKYHNSTTALNHCLRWGPQAAEDISKDWHTVVSESPCAKSVEDAPEQLPDKEKFFNAGGDCYVMERNQRVPTTALIFRPCNRLTPYVVAIGHKPGESNWEQGKYYGSLADALKEWKSWDETREVQRK